MLNWSNTYGVESRNSSTFSKVHPCVYLPQFVSYVSECVSRYPMYPWVSLSLYPMYSCMYQAMYLCIYLQIADHRIHIVQWTNRMCRTPHSFSDMENRIFRWPNAYSDARIPSVTWTIAFSDHGIHILIWRIAFSDGRLHIVIWRIACSERRIHIRVCIRQCISASIYRSPITEFILSNGPIACADRKSVPTTNVPCKNQGTKKRDCPEP